MLKKYFVISLFFVINLSATNTKVKLCEILKDSTGTVIIKVNEENSLINNNLVYEILDFRPTDTSKSTRELELVDSHSEKILLDYFDDQITLFGILLTTIVAGIGIFSLVIQFGYLKNQKKEMENNFESLKKEYDLENITLGLERNLPIRLGALIEEKYSHIIYETSKQYASEALMIAPEVRGVTLSRLRRFGDELRKHLSKHVGEDIAKGFYTVFADMARDWLVVGQFTSGSELEIEQGLGEFIQNPFPEIEHFLLRLKIRYQDNPDLSNQIQRALKALEDSKFEDELSKRN